MALRQEPSPRVATPSFRIGLLVVNGGQLQLSRGGPVVPSELYNAQWVLFPESCDMASGLFRWLDYTLGWHCPVFGV